MREGSGRARGAGRSTAGTILMILLGPILWSGHFAAIYMIQSMLCAHEVGVLAIQPIIALLTVAAAALIAIALGAPERTRGLFGTDGWSEDEQRFHWRLMTLLSVLSAVGVAWAGLTVFFVPACW